MAETDQRLSFKTLFGHLPGGFDAMRAVDKAIVDTGLDAGLIELVKLRASQINGCAYCVAFHLAEARKAEVPQRKLDLLAVWHEAPDFDETERAALGWCEALTAIAEIGAPDEIYEATLVALGEEKLAQLTLVIAHINSWNRIAGAARFKPPR